MFMHIVTQVVGLITAQFTRLYLSVTKLLLSSVSKLRVHIIQAYLNVVNQLRQLSQRVRTALSQKKDKLVGLIKLAQSHLSVSKIVQIPMVARWIQVGLKYLEAAKQLLQRVINLLKKDK